MKLAWFTLAMSMICMIIVLNELGRQSVTQSVYLTINGPVKQSRSLASLNDNSQNEILRQK